MVVSLDGSIEEDASDEGDGRIVENAATVENDEGDCWAWLMCAWLFHVSYNGCFVVYRCCRSTGSKRCCGSK